METHLISEEDSEPEEIGTKTSKETMIETFGKQKKAIRDIHEINKNKRKQINDKYVEQKISKQIAIKSVQRLPQNLLNEVNIDKTNGRSKPKEVKPLILKKKPKKKKKSFAFVTESTTFDVLNFNKDLPQLTEIKAKSKQNAINFKDITIFNKRRNRRVTPSHK